MDDGRCKLRETGDDGHDADAAHGAANVRTADQHLDRAMQLSEAVVLPKGGPGSDHQDEAGFEKVRSEQQAAERPDDQPPVCTRDRRSTRVLMSRYSPASDWSSRNTASARAVSPVSSRVAPRS